MLIDNVYEQLTDNDDAQIFISPDMYPFFHDNINYIFHELLYNNLNNTSVNILQFDNLERFDCSYFIDRKTQNSLHNIRRMQFTACELGFIKSMTELPSLKQVDFLNITGRIYIYELHEFHQQQITVNIINNTNDVKHIILYQTLYDCFDDNYITDIDILSQQYNIINNICNIVNYTMSLPPTQTR